VKGTSIGRPRREAWAFVTSEIWCCDMTALAQGRGYPSSPLVSMPPRTLPSILSSRTRASVNKPTSASIVSSAPQLAQAIEAIVSVSPPTAIAQRAVSMKDSGLRRKHQIAIGTDSIALTPWPSRWTGYSRSPAGIRSATVRSADRNASD
jgi:hypothetical protein